MTLIQQLAHFSSIERKIAEDITVSVKLFGDEHGYGIQTDCATEKEFLEQVGSLFGQFHEDGDYPGAESATVFQEWLPHIVNICCAYRGYKTTGVEEQKLYTVGHVRCAMNDPRHESHDKPTPLRAWIDGRDSTAPIYTGNEL